MNQSEILPSNECEIIEIHVDYLCRLCGQTNNDLISIYENPNTVHELETKINTYLPITVSFFLFD